VVPAATSPSQISKQLSKSIRRMIVRELLQFNNYFAVILNTSVIILRTG
jgi:hypothetical protein